jgi:hypothetical protein
VVNNVRKRSSDHWTMRVKSVLAPTSLTVIDVRARRRST